MLGELTEKMRAKNQRLADLQHGAQQPRFATEAGVEPDMKTRNRTEGAAADQARNEDSSSARVDDGPTSLTSFSMIDEPLLTTPEKCIGDVLVNKDAEASKPNIPTVEVRKLPSAAGGLLPAGPASTAMRAIFPRPLFSWGLGKKTKERTDQLNFNQFARPSRRITIQTKSRQNLVFDPCGYSDYLRGCPFLAERRALLGGGFVSDAAMVYEAEMFLLSVLQRHFREKDKRFSTPYDITADRYYFPEARKRLDRVRAQGYGNCKG